MDVSRNATYIQGPDGHGLWETCEFSDLQDHCKIWTVGGSILSDDKFIPYDGGLPGSSQEIAIAQQGGSGVIKLRNGRYLIPASGSSQEAAIRYLDFMIGKTKSFDSKKESDN